MSAKVTIITNGDGEIVAAHHGDVPRPDTDAIVELPEFRAGLMAGPGQKRHVVDAPASLAEIVSGPELEVELKALLGR
jgi:hypothetical protein